MICDGCDGRVEGQRVTITTEATDDRGVNVEVTKRWVLCEDCALGLFDRIGEPSPWVDEDWKTVVLPDEDTTTTHAGGYASRLPVG